MRRGELRSARRETEVAKAGQHETDSRRRAVDHGDDGLGHPEVVGKIGFEFGAHPVAGHGDVVTESGVVASAGHVTLEGLRVRPGTEAPPRSGDNDDPDGLVVGRPLQERPVLGVHPTRPRVQPVGPVQRDRGHPVAHLETSDLQLGQLHVSPTCRSAPHACSPRRRTGRSGAARRARPCRSRRRRRPAR